jgi:NNP family nitrate/nitrite transporter-like MFS transporter
MIPAIFRAKSKLATDGGEDPDAADRQARRMTSALIGIAAAIGAFGGVLVNVAFRQSFLTYKTGNAAYIAFIAFYVLCFAVTWAVFLRPSPRRLSGI